MAENLKPAIAADKAFSHNSKTLILALRQDDAENPDALTVYCGEMKAGGASLDAQIVRSFFLSEGQNNVAFLTDQVFNVINPLIESVYGPFSGGGAGGSEGSEPYEWVTQTIAALQTLIKTGCTFDPAAGWAVNA